MHLGAAARARRDEATRRDSPAVGGGGGGVEAQLSPTAAPNALVPVPMGHYAAGGGTAAGDTATALAWEVPRLQQELQAALDAASAAQRSAAAAEEIAAQQQASYALNLRRERERLRAEHQAEVAKVWQQIADISMDAGAPTAEPAA